jgi:predicted MFS family arabinose efflux permease
LTAPAWLAVTLELVPRSELPAAVSLSSASLNVARAVGPALGGFVVSLLGAGAAFLLNAASFLAVLAALARWRREPIVTLLPREQVFGAMRSGLRFVRHSPALKRILQRVGIFVFFASSLWALLPVVARQDMQSGATGYGTLLGSLGIGAVIGALVLPRLRARLAADTVVDGASLAYAVVAGVVGLWPSFPLACGVLTVSGFCWMVPLSTLNVETQSVAPAWVRARALAFHLLVLQGGLAVGSALWGWTADHLDAPRALQVAAGGLLLAIAASQWLRLRPTAHIDLTPAVAWPPREVVEAAEYDAGPVLVTIEYEIDPTREEDFLETMEAVRRMRRRGGARRWGIFADAARPGTYVESFLVESWLDHLRQHERMTVSDRNIGERARAFHIGAEPPAVRHLVARLPVG